MRIGVIVDWVNPTMAETFRILAQRGVRVNLVHPEQQMIDVGTVSVENDLYLLKSGTDLALSLAGALHALGAPTLNPYPTVSMMRNKIIVTRVLQAAGVPTPETYVAADAKDLLPLLDGGLLLLKPYRGSRGVGIRVIRQASELEDAPLDGPVLVQRYKQPDGRDHKIYCIGGQLFGVKRVWPLKTYADKDGEPFDPSPELREIALRCGRAFGIDLYGLDVVFSDGHPYVVDVQKFGSYMGVPDAPRLLADYVYSAGQRLLAGEPLLLAVSAERSAAPSAVVNAKT